MSNAFGFIKIHVIRRHIWKNNNVIFLNFSCKTDISRINHIAFEAKIPQKIIKIIFFAVRIIYENRIRRQFFLAHSQCKRMCIHDEAVLARSEHRRRNKTNIISIERTPRFNPKCDIIFSNKILDGRLSFDGFC